MRSSFGNVVPFELKGVTLELLCSERYVITAVNKPLAGAGQRHLLSNALAACGKGGWVTVTLLAQSAPMCSSQADNGRGIPPEQQDMLRTWHLQPQTPEYLTGGLGIGLPVASGDEAPRRPDAAGQQGGAGHHRNAGAPAEKATSAVLHEPAIEYHGVASSGALVELAGALPHVEAYLIKTA